MAAPGGAWAGEPAEADVSKKTVRKLESYIAKRSWKKARALLDEKAKASGKAWCDLNFETRSTSHHARLFTDVAFMARKVKRIDEAWACLYAVADVGGPVYAQGTDGFSVMGLTREAGFLYEAALVLPKGIKKSNLAALEARVGSTRRANASERSPYGPYSECSDGMDGENTQRFAACVAQTAVGLKKEGTFDARQMKDALLWRSVELVPRPSVVKKLSKRRRATFIEGWKARSGLEARRSTAYAGYDAARAAIEAKMNPGKMPPCKRGVSEGDEGYQECVAFKVSKGARHDEEGAWWREWVALARDDLDGVYGDSCYRNVMYVARAVEGAEELHAVELDRLYNDEVCGSGGWGDWRQAGVDAHDPKHRTITLHHTYGAVYKSGGSSFVEEDSMPSWTTSTRYVCHAAGEGASFTCLVDTRRWDADEDAGDAQDVRQHLRRGAAPSIVFVDGKATWEVEKGQYVLPQYDALKGKTFEQVVKLLPGVDAAIVKAMGG
jgi:hypothetical protein